MKPEEILAILTIRNYASEFKTLDGRGVYQQNKGYQKKPKIRQGKSFVPVNVLGITPAQYRRLKMSKKSDKK